MAKNSDHYKAQAIITAAGKSSRMGSPKALLNINGQTFIQHIVSIYRRQQIFCLVVTSDLLAPDLTGPVQNGGGCLLAGANPDWHMIDSLRYGLDHLPAAQLPLFIQPVDMPFVTEALLAALLPAATTHQFVIPLTAAGPGHPLLIATAQRSFLASATCDLGLQSALQKQKIHYLPWPDNRISCNINTPSDYQKLVKNFTCQVP